MKRIILSFAVVAGVAFSMTSCDFNKNGTDYSKFYANALVTVKHDAEGVFYLQLDDKTTAKPSNLKKSPFGEKQVRALAHLTVGDQPATDINNSRFDKVVMVDWIDSVRTKSIVPTLGDRDYVVYGNDPIDVVGNWVTIVEDGYLTLSFRAQWGSPNKVHAINLVSGTDPKNPYVLVLRHNAFDDYYTSSGSMDVNGIVAFDLASLPPTGGKDVDLIIKYRSAYFGGEHTVKFKYCTGKSSETGSKPSFDKVAKGLNID